MQPSKKTSRRRRRRRRRTTTTTTTRRRQFKFLKQRSLVSLVWACVFPIAKHLCVERYTTFEGKLFGVSKTAYVFFFWVFKSLLYSNNWAFFQCMKKKQHELQIQIFLRRFWQCRRKGSPSCFCCAAAKRRSSVARGRGGGKARLRDTSKRSGPGPGTQFRDLDLET
jgi:hypothetical protein